MKRINFRPLNIITIVCVLVLSGLSIISNADESIESAKKNFSAIGFISEITDKNFVINNAKGSDKSGNTVYDFNLRSLDKIETNSYEKINLSDLRIGDKVIVQGLTNGNDFFIKRIISFASKVDLVATTTEAVTEATTTATTTEMMSSGSSGDMVTSDDIASTTPVGTIIITETTASTTSVGDTATTETSTTVEEESSKTSTLINTGDSVVGTITNTIQDTIENIIQTVTDIVVNDNNSNPDPTPIQNTEKTE